MKLLSISFSFKRGGAGLAADQMTALVSEIDGISVRRLSQDQAGWKMFFLRVISWILSRLEFTRNPIKHSLNLFSFQPLRKEIVNSIHDIFHLHWINNDTLSVFEFKKIPSWSIVTLHDEWLFCGIEHYRNYQSSSQEYLNGYTVFGNFRWGFPWSALIWNVKFKALGKRKDLIFTVPSNWMKETAQKSKILRFADIRILPNVIDTRVFIPLEAEKRKTIRRNLGFCDDDILLLFGAVDGTKNPIKGGDILNQALDLVSKSITPSMFQQIKLVFFGSKKKYQQILYGFNAYSVGFISDRMEMAEIYSCCDVLLMPSKIESFGQVAAESLSCGTPVVCFQTSGLNDIIEDGKSGLFAKPFSYESFASKIIQLIELSPSERQEFGKRGRSFVQSHFSPQAIKPKYLEILKEAYTKRSKS